MGTNYYFYENICEKCGRSDERTHIGKSSAGWVFALHVYPDDGINTLEDWGQRWFKAGSIIKDEYGRVVDHREMYRIIAERHWAPKDQTPAWYAQNQAMPGPNGLVRAKIDGHHIIGHGEGTWDYHVGEFS